MVRTQFHYRWQVILAFGLLSLAIIAGCQPATRRPIAVRLPLFCPAEPTVVPDGVTLCGPIGAESGIRQPRNVLALSGGGLYGAYSSGFLSGWTQTGTRPEFDVVTGVSTGALIAPFAFLGSEFDSVAMNLYTSVRAKDVFRIRVWVTIPFKDAAASSAPLKKLIESQISQPLLDRVAAEHRKGRRLYVATTNLTSRRLVVWDMGAIAGLPPPTGANLARDVLLASCAVPGMLPPVTFVMPGPDGTPVNQMHVDGGVTSQIFVPSTVFDAASANAPGMQVVPGVNGNVYALVAGKLYPDATPVHTFVLPILAATTESIMYAHCRAELGKLYGQARLAGMQFHLTALRQDLVVNVDNLLSIDQKEMGRLYCEGERDALSGPAWEYAPPELCPTTVEPFIRGHRFQHK
jgi:predicted acylesterase/phospholipase RssA